MVKNIDPEIVYIPLTDSKSKLASIKVEKGAKVKVGTLLAEKYGKDRTPVFSSVSGTVEEVTNRTDLSGNEVKHIAIKNDKKYAVDESCKPLGKDESLFDKINSLGIKDLDKKTIYTGLHKGSKAVFVDAIYPNEFISMPSYEVLAKRIKRTVAVAEDLAKENDGVVYIVVSKKLPKDIAATLIDSEKVKFVKACCKSVWQYSLVKKLTGVELEVGTYKGVDLVGESTLAAVADAKESGLPAVKKTFSIYSDVVGCSTVSCPVGTPIVELFKTKEDVVVTVGNIFNGKTVVCPSTVVNEATYCINVLKPTCQCHDGCVRCGACNDVCPVGLLPSEIIIAVEGKDENRLKELHIEKCIECGRCSFVCPTHINVLEEVRRAKRRMQ